MLRRKPSRVEERADVSDEYEYYLREKERRQQQQEQQQRQQREGGAAGANTNMNAEQQAAELARQRRDNMRARLGLSSMSSLG